MVTVRIVCMYSMIVTVLVRIKMYVFVRSFFLQFRSSGKHIKSFVMLTIN